MRKGFFGLGLSALFFVLSVPADAQQPKKIARIGFLVDGTPSTHSTRIQAFRQGLREAGYVEGKTIAIEYRYAAGAADRLPDLLTELVNLKVDVIVTAGTRAVLAAKKATQTIPIVFASVGNPVGTGIVDSLAQPGGTSQDCRALLET